MIDTTSEPGSYASALRSPPWIEDRDGFTFYNGAFLSPDMRFERGLQAVKGGGDSERPAFSPVLLSPFHSTATTQPEQRDHD